MPYQYNKLPETNEEDQYWGGLFACLILAIGGTFGIGGLAQIADSYRQPNISINRPSFTHEDTPRQNNYSRENKVEYKVEYNNTIVAPYGRTIPVKKEEVNPTQE